MTTGDPPLYSYLPPLELEWVIAVDRGNRPSYMHSYMHFRTERERDDYFDMQTIQRQQQYSQRILDLQVALQNDLADIQRQRQAAVVQPIKSIHWLLDSTWEKVYEY